MVQPASGAITSSDGSMQPRYRARNQEPDRFKPSCSTQTIANALGRGAAGQSARALPMQTPGQKSGLGARMLLSVPSVSLQTRQGAPIRQGGTQSGPGEVAAQAERGE